MNELFMLTDSAWLSALIWSAIGVSFLYLARMPARRAISALTRIFHNALRLTAQAINRAEQGMAERNRAVLLAAGREAKERMITREFERISATVERDLTRYPETQRLLAETIHRIDEDHKNSTDVPPEVPGWGKAVEAVAKVSTKGDSTVRDVLEAIHGALAKAEERSLDAYRTASKERHRLLSRMMPAWQRIQGTLKSMDRSVKSILERSRSIDRHMDEYRDIVAASDRAAQSLSHSSLVQFFIASFVIAIAIGGAFINFSLIARPMSEMVGGTSYIGAFQTADIAALVIILVEISMGLFLMESLRITRLFPVIAALPDRTRIYMVWITLTILTVLASIEAGLAYMREILLQDELATTSLLRGGTGAGLANEALWITTAAQMGMGFILPFALTFVAIPLETFVQTARHVMGLVVIGVLRLVSLTLRVVGNIVRQIGSLLQHLYDLVIFAPLWVERWAEQRNALRRARRADQQDDAPEAPQQPAAKRPPRDNDSFGHYGEVSA
jgi:hypothetical protein